MLKTFLSLPVSETKPEEAYTLAWRPAGAKSISLSEPHKQADTVEG